MHSVFQFDRSEHAFATRPLAIQKLVDLEQQHNGMLQYVEGKTAKAV
jgi:hypothetical protein